MTSASRKIAFGFSPHTGWAQAVVVAGPLSAPKVLHRERIDLGVGETSIHLFHTAAEMAFAAAQTHIARCKKIATTNADRALTVLTNVHGSNAAVAVVVGNSKLPPLETILKSHMLIHSAEGDFYRRAILDAAEARELKGTAVPVRELPDAASAVLKLSVGRLPQWLTDYGKTVGRPWGRDEKDAFLAACVALGASRSAGRAS